MLSNKPTSFPGLFPWRWEGRPSPSREKPWARGWVINLINILLISSNTICDEIVSCSSNSWISCTFSRGRTPIKGWQWCSFYLLGVKHILLVTLRAFSLKRSTAGTFKVHFRLLSRKNMAWDNVLCKNWYLLWVKKAMATKLVSFAEVFWGCHAPPK